MTPRAATVLLLLLAGQRARGGPSDTSNTSSTTDDSDSDSGSGSGSGSGLEIADGFAAIEESSCGKSYGKYMMIDIPTAEECQEAIGGNSSMFQVEVVDMKKLPPGCNYHKHPLLPGGYVVFFNINKETKKYCKPELAVCLCEQHDRRGVVIGTGFMFLVAGIGGAVLLVVLLVWFNFVRLSKFERDRQAQLKNALVEQLGPGGFATTIALKPFGDNCVNLTWRFGDTEGDVREEEKRHGEHRSGIKKLVLGTQARYYDDPGYDDLDDGQPLASKADSPLAPADPISDAAPGTTDENDVTYRMHSENVDI